jgi:putative transcriptional regulator
MTKKNSTNDVERDLLDGFEHLVQSLRSGAPLTSRRIALDLVPHAYSAARVKATRRLLRVSQTLFACFIGVSAKTVRAWERGQAPSVIACRFMDEIRHNPSYWRQRLSECAAAKAS